MYNVSNWILLTVLTIANWVDYDTTKMMVARDGPGIENNPLMKLSIDTFGIEGILVWKIAALMLMATYINWIPNRILAILTVVVSSVALANTHHVLAALV